MGGSQAGVRYKVAIERQAKRGLEKRIDNDIVQKIIQTIDRLAQDPYLGKPLKGPLKGQVSAYCLARLQSSLSN